ncbi:hypothetical protein AQV86_00245 [Nanohaloarchaea archaeon SG9]|nr:hypothetical protein AQV86_00245 [Nanohaloarchaea archaeon SG9]
MSRDDEIEQIEHVERLARKIDGVHGEIEADEKDLSKEHQAVREDLKKFRNGDLSAKKMKRILEEFEAQEEEQEELIEYEERSIKDTRKALQELQDTINKISEHQKQEMKNFNNATKGIENALGSIANADSFKEGVDGAISQMWNSVENMETDMDEEAEMSEDLDILGHELGKAVKEDEELLKDEEDDYNMEKIFGQILEEVGAEAGEKKDQKLAEKDKEEFEQTKEEFSQIEDLTEKEEEEVKELYKEVKKTVEEAKEMYEDIDELIEDIKEAPGDQNERIRKLHNMQTEIDSNVTEAQKAMEKLQEVGNFTDKLESEERNAESALI